MTGKELIDKIREIEAEDAEIIGITGDGRWYVLRDAHNTEICGFEGDVLLMVWGEEK